MTAAPPPVHHADTSRITRAYTAGALNSREIAAVAGRFRTTKLKRGASHRFAAALGFNRSPRLGGSTRSGRRLSGASHR